MNNPVVSVVIPAFNEEKSIAKCLQSVCGQDFNKPFEVILVNNNSSDKTEEIASKFPVKILSEPKQGYVYALIKGFSQAKGEYVALTDADTVVPRDWLSKIYFEYKNDSKTVAVGGGAVMTPKNFYLWVIDLVLNAASSIFKIFSGFNFSVKKSTYDQLGGFREDLNFNVDTDLCFRLKRCGRVVFLRDNKVITSSRHYRGIKGIFYSAKGILNVISLKILNRTLFFNFGDAR